MRILVREILPQLLEYVNDSGVAYCPGGDNTRAVAALNKACQALSYRIDDPGSLYYINIRAQNGCFSLPQDCLEGRQFWVNGNTATQFDQWYMGKVACGLNGIGPTCYGPNIIDQGEWPLPFDLLNIKGVKLAFVAQSDADAGVTIDLRIRNPYGEVVAETLTLLPKQNPVLTTSVVQDLEFLEKPLTNNNVKCYQALPNGQKFLICDYEPNTRLGAFRRKRLPNPLCPGCNVVTILGKRRYIPIVSESDLCPFDNLMGLAFALKAVAAAARGEVDTYTTQLQAALNEIYKQMRDSTSAGVVAQIQFRTGMGCNMSQFTNRPLPGTSWRGRGTVAGGWF